MEVRELTYLDEKAFLEGLEFWQGEDLAWYTFSWQEGMEFKPHVDQLKKEKLGEDLQADWVPATMLYAFVEGKIIGRVHLRHTLNENLLKRGGHIGYAVAPQFRGRGYAKEMLLKGLEYCSKELNLSKVLITCASDNAASTRMIKFVGGEFAEEVYDDVDKEMICKYWVHL
ncbi:MAG: GNAT family N-acetyltransferase [Bdellovibrionales bacterium]